MRLKTTKYFLGMDHRVPMKLAYLCIINISFIMVLSFAYVILIKRLFYGTPTIPNEMSVDHVKHVKSAMKITLPF